ncbi:MAG: hypothetical protein JXB26_08940 [Candidatus Aminicenantes bacterium]|nr:hypothetical protein [Candidatus Aminicenantes bacterium]
MNNFRKTLPAIVLLLSVPVLVVASDKKGADIKVITTEGSQARGELIAIKEKAILILERDTGRDNTIVLTDIDEIVIVKKSKLIFGTVMGTLAGGVVGTLIGVLVSFTQDENDNTSWEYGKKGGPIGMAAGALGGAYLGGRAGKDERIKFSQLSAEEKTAFLKKLRNLARMEGQKNILKQPL